MKKIILIASLITFSNLANCQKNTLINTKDLSPLSFGAMPVVFASADQGPGLGLELNTRYALSEDFGVGVFGRMKSIMEEASSNYGYSEIAPEPAPSGVDTRNVFAVGASADYNIFKAVVLQLRGGYELEADNQERVMIPRAIFGGGLMIKFAQSQTHKVAHSLRFAVDFESNRYLGVTFPTADFSDFPYSQNMSTNDGTINAFSFQVGWNFQFHSIKRKR